MNAKNKPAPQTATKEYARAHIEIAALLKIIEARIPHGDCRNANWGDVGTLQNVRARLTQIAIGLDLADGSEKAAQTRLDAEMLKVAEECK